MMCPECSGPSADGHPGGVLGGWRHTLACPLLAHEDSRLVADRDRNMFANGFTRQATATERILLSALGNDVGESVYVDVSRATPSITRRDFSWEVSDEEQ